MVNATYPFTICFKQATNSLFIFVGCSTMAARNSYVFHEEDEDTELFKDLPEDYNDFDVELEEDDLIISSDLITRQAKFKKLSVS